MSTNAEEWNIINQIKFVMEVKMKKKAGILNSNLFPRYCGQWTYGYKLVIGDSGLPIPRNSELVDLALKPNVPRFLELLKQILEELVV